MVRAFASVGNRGLGQRPGLPATQEGFHSAPWAGNGLGDNPDLFDRWGDDAPAPFNLPFRGTRQYLHSTDRFPALNRLAQERFSPAAFVESLVLLAARLKIMPFPFGRHAGAVAARADRRFLDSAVAIAPAALGMTKVVLAAGYIAGPSG